MYVVTAVNTSIIYHKMPLNGIFQTVLWETKVFKKCWQTFHPKLGTTNLNSFHLHCVLYILNVPKSSTKETCLTLLSLLNPMLISPHNFYLADTIFENCSVVIDMHSVSPPLTSICAYHTDVNICCQYILLTKWMDEYVLSIVIYSIVAHQK